MASSRFTRAELEAIQEALIFRSCGELGDDAHPFEDYDTASAKISARLARYPARPDQDEDE